MRRTVQLAIAAAAALMLSACGGSDATDSSGSSGDSGGASAAAGDETFEISFSNYTEAAPLFRVIHTNLDKAVKDSGAKVKVKWYDNAGDPAKMLQNAQLMVRDKPDAIVIYPVSNATQGVGKVLGDSKIPCVSVNLDTAQCNFLNIDNRALGEGSAEIIGKIAKEKGWNASNTTVLIGQNAAAGEQVNDCVRYFYSTIAPILGMEAVDATSITAKTTKVGANAIQFDGGSQLQPSFEAVKNLLPSIPKGNNIILYTVNNDSTNGALRALEDAGRAGNDKLLIGGLGGDEAGIKALREDPRWVAEGDIFVSWWGEYAVAMAQALAKGETPPKDVTALPQIVLDKESVDQYHAPGSVDVKLLPPLDESNQFLSKGGFLQDIGNIEGL
ncbi:MAG: periplasmic binding protein/LacI transcriptional regulator [Marmoricola sp.]|jgi:ribose transport system substrate-binding protein|nr:periplasmic binding protein/LacI transcriptional regulator [Marmoricola sp.]MDQ1620780.1 ribose transport system substrate-binding protein [Actinomycetota bacterium]MDQ1665338.1 ribose transport system substrate-binding protein [Actinomycetota bacterium]